MERSSDTLARFGMGDIDNFATKSEELHVLLEAPACVSSKHDKGERGHLLLWVATDPPG